MTNSPSPTDTLETWLDYLEKSHFKPIDLGLERIKRVAEELDLLQPAPYVITVAGTNGKGSTCRLLEVALMKAGKRVGVYSSPHLIRYNERVRIQGELLVDEEHVRSFASINANKTESLTYFEFSTLSALQLFKAAELDVVILEVGLGGRLDATNIVDADFAVITSIDIDHVAFLGDNREDIGREKAGICRENKPLVIGETDCPKSILEAAKALHCTVFQRNVDWHLVEQGENVAWQSQNARLDLPASMIPTPNVGTAVTVLKHLPFSISDELIQQAVAEASITGRFQRLTEQDFRQFSGVKPQAQVIIDVGHNPHAARYLAKRLEAVKKSKIFAVFSVLEDKDLSGIVEPLAGLIDEWHCAGLAGFRGQSGEVVQQKLQASLPHAKTAVYANVSDAMAALFEKAGQGDLILVFGSFHTVADGLLYISQ